MPTSPSHPKSPVEALPHSIEAEVNCLGSMLRDPRLISVVAQKVKAEDFYRDAHRTIFTAITELDMAGKKPDLSLLAEQLKGDGALEKAGGSAYLVKIMEEVPIPLNAAHYAQIVLDYAMRRAAYCELQKVGQTAADMSCPIMDILSSAEKGIGQCRERLSAGERLDINALAHRVFDQIESYKYPDKRGLVTGFLDLDKLMGGIKKQHFIVIAGRPSMGKSTLSFNIARKSVEVKKKVLIVSLEMGADDVLYSMIMAYSRVNSNRIKDGFATDEEVQRLALSMGAFTEFGCLWIEEPKQNDLYAVKSLIREHHQSHGLDLVIIDYLQLMEVGSSGKQKRYENRQQEVSTISRTIKMMTRELEVPIIGICQLNRGAEGREDHRPKLSDLRETGALEQDADTVLLLYRDDYYNRNSPTPNICEVEVAKNRGGRTGVIETVFLRDMLLFESKADIPVGDGFAPPSDARVPD